MNVELAMTSEEKLKHCFVEGLGIDHGQITDDLAYQSISQWDSTAHMALVAVLEQEFEVMLDTDDIIGMSTYAVARDTLKKHGVSF